MTGALEQQVLGMRFIAARVLSRGILKEIRKAGACGDSPFPRTYIFTYSLELGTCVEWGFMAPELLPK